MSRLLHWPPKTKDVCLRGKKRPKASVIVETPCQLTRLNPTIQEKNFTISVDLQILILMHVPELQVPRQRHPPQTRTAHEKPAPLLRHAKQGTLQRQAATAIHTRENRYKRSSERIKKSGETTFRLGGGGTVTRKIDSTTNIFEKSENFCLMMAQKRCQEELASIVFSGFVLDLRTSECP